MNEFFTIALNVLFTLVLVIFSILFPQQTNTIFDLYANYINGLFVLNVFLSIVSILLIFKFITISVNDKILKIENLKRLLDGIKAMFFLCILLIVLFNVSSNLVEFAILFQNIFICIVVLRSVCLGIGVHILTDLTNVVFGGGIIVDDDKNIVNK